MENAEHAGDRRLQFQRYGASDTLRDVYPLVSPGPGDTWRSKSVPGPTS